MKKFIYKENKIKRLDHYLNEKMDDISRSQIQKLIKNSNITVNGLGKSPNYKLKTDDKIEIISLNSSTKKNNGVEDTTTPINYKIIDETTDFLVVYKPAGIVVHRSGKETISLIDLILKTHPLISKVGEDPSRPGIVHRLDKDVSGLLVIAKNMDTFDLLKSQFQKRKIKKSYQALVYGSIIKDEDTIKFPIARSTSGHKMAALPLAEESNERGRSAITEYHKLKSYINYTHLRLFTKTGRTHQIRAHMSAYGHPIVGDELYGTKKTKEMNKKLNMNRVFLIADELTFTDSDDKVRSYKIEIEDELKQLLNKVK